VASKSLPCGLVIGKSLRCLAIVVENLFRPYNGRSAQRHHFFRVLFDPGVRNVCLKPESLFLEGGAAPGAPLRPFAEDARSLPIAVSISLLILVILGIHGIGKQFAKEM
jgi:hypothetical protein